MLILFVCVTILSLFYVVKVLKHFHHSRLLMQDRIRIRPKKFGSDGIRICNTTDRRVS